jgi:hypothetical protein
VPSTTARDTANGRSPFRIAQRYDVWGEGGHDFRPVPPQGASAACQSAGAGREERSCERRGSPAQDQEGIA